MSEKVKDTRHRNFVTIVYPESAPDDWQTILADQCVPAFISPLHDADINADGESKKAHYHVMLMFEGKKSLEQVADFVEMFGGLRPQWVQSLRGHARYLCHLDNPEKAQYSADNVRSLAGADYLATIGTVLDKYKAISEMIDYCCVNKINSYSELLIYCKEERFDWFRVLCDNGSYVMKEFLKSSVWTSKQQD